MATQEEILIANKVHAEKVRHRRASIKAGTWLFKKDRSKLTSEEKAERARLSTANRRAKDRSAYNAYQRSYNKGYRQLQRQKIFNMLGGCCSNCGITDFDVLQIHHVDGGGTADRIAKGHISGSSVAYYRKLLKELDSDKYRLLCANCHLKISR